MSTALIFLYLCRIAYMSIEFLNTYNYDVVIKRTSKSEQ